MVGEIAPFEKDTLRNRVERALREGIASGDFKPGTRLIERELCERFGVSRPSVREALRKLESEKLVQVLPHGGLAVAVLSKDEAKDLYAIRTLLEGYIAREFLRLADEAAIRSLAEFEQVIAASKLTSDSGHLSSFWKTFHGIVQEHCGCSLAIELVEGLALRTDALVDLYSPIAQPVINSVRAIDEFFKALLARDGDAAEAAARECVISVRKDVTTGA